MSKWIDCSERLPSGSEEVIVYAGEYGVFVATFKSMPRWQTTWWETPYGNSPKVTHWIPLPEPPEEVA